MADYLEDLTLRDKVLAALVKSVNQPYHFPDHEFFVTAFESTPANSPLRAMLVDLVVKRSPIPTFKQDHAKYPQELVYQVCTKLMDWQLRKKSGSLGNVELADYVRDVGEQVRVKEEDEQVRVKEERDFFFNEISRGWLYPHDGSSA